jgi:hypothetical protein
MLLQVVPPIGRPVSRGRKLRPKGRAVRRMLSRDGDVDNMRCGTVLLLHHLVGKGRIWGGGRPPGLHHAVVTTATAAAARSFWRLR